ncbi:patatin-like phospholipase family protein [Mycobacterium sp. 155]|uniref:patatin-like phospholipase family protein n=1 Tax=Mycobacterium sp. 155 TaxID=1157943 RepID=UPI0018DEEAA8|nr:patatin-like phospholipase family protein [Mycobacterium sp. 155]
MTEEAQPIRVAIACQGGGSHTAFTAGVLGRLLEPDVTDKYKIVGLSGTSGGAICALLSWTALVDSQPQKAVELLEGFWADNATSSPAEWIMNWWTVWAGYAANYVATPQISPYMNPASDLGLKQMRDMLETWVDFDRLNHPDGDDPESERPMLVLGAVDVLSGVFKAFNSRKGEITAEAVMASSALPNLFRSVPVGDSLYWDGLFSQNPPIRDLLPAKPDEIWVIQINAQSRSTEPTTVNEIADRRNELAGNLSLYQELHFIEKIGQMLEAGVLRSAQYRPIAVRIIEKSRSEKSRRLGTVSKMNRDPAFLRGLIDDGAATADDFVTALDFERAWRSKDADGVFKFFADDCKLISTDPFSIASLHGDKDGLHGFITEQLAREIEVDMTRRQFAGDEVRWRVRFSGGDAGECADGQAGARFEDGKIVRFTLGAG